MLHADKVVAFVPITNSENSRAFYEGVLGLPFIGEDDFAMVFEANGVTVRAVKMKEFKPVPYTILGWEVSGIENVIRNLREKGVRFEVFGFFKQDELGIWTAPGGAKVAWFKDPDGNLLSVSQNA